jgi:hypothetical protein
MSERSKYSLKGARKSDIAFAAVFTIAFGVLVAVLAFNGPFKSETNANQPVIPTVPTTNPDYASVSYGPLLLLPGIGILAVGIGVIVFALRHKFARIFVGQGMLAWLGVIIIGSILGGFFDKGIQSVLGVGFGFDLYKGLSLGLIYALVVYSIAARGLRGGGWQDAVGFGMGYGLVEQVAVGAAYLVFAGGVLVSGRAPLAALPTLDGLNNSLVVALIPIVSGFAFIFIHATSATMVFYATRFAGSARWLWLLLAALYEGAILTVDVAALTSSTGFAGLAQQWPVAVAIILWAALGYTITIWLRPRFPTFAKAEDNGGQLVGKPL